LKAKVTRERSSWKPSTSPDVTPWNTRGLAW
jgi:hypothetical protein